jgi:hypothetical protein
MLTPEEKDIEIDLRKLVKHQIQENGIVCHNNRVTNGLEKQSLAIQQRAENTLLPKDLVITSVDAVMVEKKACRLRMLTNAVQPMKPQETEESLGERDIMPNKKFRSNQTSAFIPH